MSRPSAGLCGVLATARAGTRDAHYAQVENDSFCSQDQEYAEEAIAVESMVFL